MNSRLQQAGIQCYWVRPGRLLAGEYPAPLGSAEDDSPRLHALLDAGIDAIVDLTRSGELFPYRDLLESAAAARDTHVGYRRFPMIDHAVPEPSEMNAVLDHIDASLAQGRNLYLHCWGGIGRTGMTVGCFLVRHGLAGQQALDRLASWWLAVPKHTLHPRSPETPEQLAFVLGWRDADAAHGGQR